MKRIYYILSIAMLLAACQKEPKSSQLLEEYQALNDRVAEQLSQDLQPEAADSIITAFIDEALALQQAEPGSEAAYVILADIYYMLDMPQKIQAFSVLDVDSIEAHGLERHLRAFQAEQATMPGEQYTDFTVYTKDGEQVALSSLVGQKDYLLVDFWASWCGPCRRSMPALKALQAEYGNKLAIVGISVDNDPEAWQKAVSELELTWTQLRDTNDEGSNAYGIMAIPHTVLISRDGTILAHNPEHEQIAELLK